MKPVRLASKPQASSRAGPFLGPRATGVPESKKKCYHAIRDGFPQVLRNNFFFGRTPLVGNSDVVVFWPVLGLGHLDKFRAQAENRKTQFPGTRGPEIEKKSYHAVRDGCPQLFYVLRFGRPDPQGRKIAKYGYFRPFWPRTAFGT